MSCVNADITEDFMLRKKYWLVRGISLLAVCLLNAGVVRAQQPTNPAAAMLKSHIIIKPHEIKWGDCPPVIPPGAQCAVIEGDTAAPNALFAYRLKMPDNFRIPPHFHPADEHVLVISGILNVGTGNRVDIAATHSLSPGGFMVMPKGASHFAWTKGETIVHVYAIGPWGLTYVNPKDDPRKSALKPSTK